MHSRFVDRVDNENWYSMEECYESTPRLLLDSRIGNICNENQRRALPDVMLEGTMKDNRYESNDHRIELIMNEDNDHFDNS